METRDVNQIAAVGLLQWPFHCLGMRDSAFCHLRPAALPKTPV
jgi:hypothetical protein